MIETDSFTCVVCRTEQGEVRLEINGYQLAACRNCRLIQVTPMPFAAAIEAHYQQQSYFKGDSAQGYRDYDDMEKALQPFFKRRLRRLKTLVPAHGDLLDFGCATGYFLEMAQNDGWRIQGVELSKPIAAIAAERLGIPIKNHLDELKNQFFDAITLWEVVEHLREPMETLSRFHERLIPGGVLSLSTPNTAHWQAVRLPNQWEGYRPPSHLLFFTPETMRETLLQAGFVDIHIYRTAPKPELPNWLHRRTAKLQKNLAEGSARPWLLALLTWRLVRIAGLAWHRMKYPGEDVYATLEVTAVKPS